MKHFYRHILLVLMMLFSSIGLAQADTTGAAAENDLKRGFVEGVGQFFDVEMLDHSIQTRGLVKKQNLKDSLQTYSEKTGGKLTIAVISSLNIDELWPDLLNRKKFYSVDGKFALDSNYFENGSSDADVTDGSYVIGLTIDVDTLASEEEYGVIIKGKIDQGIISFLQTKNVNTDSLAAKINTHFTTFFAQSNNAGPYTKPNEAPVAEAVIGLLRLLDTELGQYYEELFALQAMSDNISEIFPVANEGFKVVFSGPEAMTFGYDRFDDRFVDWVDQYDFVQLGDNTVYKVDAKSMAIDVADVVRVTFVDSNATHDVANISFKYKNGTSLTGFTFVNGTAVLTLPAVSSKGVTKLYAYYNDKEIGKLTLHTYTQKSEKVVIVPVNCAVNPTQTELQNYLNLVYKNGVVDWNVTVATRWDNTTWDSLTPGKLEAADATLMTKYSKEMRALRNAYFESIGDAEDKEAYYIFVVDDFTTANLNGYMVIGKSVGFVKNNSSATFLKRTIAHELGHGAFGLRHHFDVAPAGSTERLMDYATAEKFAKPDWHEIHSKIPDWSRFDDEEEFESVLLEQIEQLTPLANDDGSFTFYNPKMEMVTFPPNITAVWFSTMDNLASRNDSQTYSGVQGEMLKSIFSVVSNKNAPLGTLLMFKDDKGVLYTFNGSIYVDANNVEENLSMNVSNSNGIQVFLAFDSNIQSFVLIAGVYEASDLINDAEMQVNFTSLVQIADKYQSESYEFNNTSTYAPGFLPFNQVLNDLSNKPIIKMSIPENCILFASDDARNVRIINFLKERLLLEAPSFSGMLYSIYAANLEERDYTLLENCDLFIGAHQLGSHEIKERICDAYNLSFDETEFSNIELDGNLLSYIISQNSGDSFYGNKYFSLADYEARIFNSKNIRQEWEGFYLNNASNEQVYQGIESRSSLYEFYSCVFASLSIEAKKYILNAFLGDDYSNDYWYSESSIWSYEDGYFILNDLFSSLVQGASESDKVDILGIIREDNYKFIRRLWQNGASNFPNGVSRQDIFSFLETLSLFEADLLASKSEFDTQIDLLINSDNPNIAYYAASLIGSVNEKYADAEDVVNLLKKYGEQNWYALTDEEELVVLKLFESVSPTSLDNVSVFLSSLESEKIGGESVIEFYYENLNFDEFKKAILYLTELAQLTYNQDYFIDVVNAGGDILTINVESERGWLFYSDNINAKISNGDILVSGNQILENLEFEINGKIITVPYSWREGHRLKFFDPIINVNSGDAQASLDLPKGARPFPAMYLLAIEDLNNNSNTQAGIELTVDIITTFTGVGNLLKLRLLTKTGQVISNWQKAKMFLGGVEVTLGFADVTLKYATSNCSAAWVNVPICESISELIFWMEIGTLTSDLSIGYNIKKEAQKLKLELDAIQKPIGDTEFDDFYSEILSLSEELVNAVDDAFNSILSIQNLRNIPGISLKQLDNIGLTELQNLKSTNSIGQFVNVSKAEIITINKPLNKSNFYSHSGFDNFQSKIPNGSPSANQNSKIFNTSTAPSSTGQMIPRHNDAEVKIFEDIASQLGASKGDVGTKVFNDVTGKIRIKTELCPCGSCSGVIEEFKTMFPEVELEILAQPKVSF